MTAKRLIAFDLDDTLAVTKSPVSDRMAGLLARLLEHYEVAIISGGTLEQFRRQVIDRLEAEPSRLVRLHLLPTCGTRYVRYEKPAATWKQVYAENLSDGQKREVIAVLEAGAKELGLWEEKPAGDIIEDRGSQITFSALGQKAAPEAKYAWDPDGTKKARLRTYAAERLPELEVRAGGSTSVDITRLGIDKAYGMGKLLEELSMDKTAVLFVGDRLQEGGNDYPVKLMGIDCLEVTRWEDTAYLLDGLLAVSGSSS